MQCNNASQPTLGHCQPDGGHWGQHIIVWSGQADPNHFLVGLNTVPALCWVCAPMDCAQNWRLHLSSVIRLCPKLFIKLSRSIFEASTSFYPWLPTRVTISARLSWSFCVCAGLQILTARLLMMLAIFVVVISRTWCEFDCCLLDNNRELQCQ